MTAIVRSAAASSGRAASSVSRTVLSMPEASIAPSRTIWIEFLVRARADDAAEVAPASPRAASRWCRTDVVAGMGARVVVGPGRTPEVREGARRVVSADDHVREVDGLRAVAGRGHHGRAEELDGGSRPVVLQTVRKPADERDVDRARVQAAVLLL